MKRLRTAGFSLIDAVLAIVLVASAFVALAGVLSETSLKNANVDISTAAILLARGKMAQVKAMDFASVADVSNTSFGGYFSNYSYAIDVEYVDEADLTTPAAGATDYKRVEVVVGCSGWAGSVDLYDLMVDL